MPHNCVVFWFRRDLRLHDNTALSKALESGVRILPVFIFDSHILATLEKDDRRVSFIYQALKLIHQSLRELGSGLHIEFGSPLEAFERICDRFQPSAAYINTDYEPYAVNRDSQIGTYLNARGIALLSFKDQVIFEKKEILTDAGKPYTVFTPYSRKWLSTLDYAIGSTPIKYSLSRGQFLPIENTDFLSLDQIGFAEQYGQFNVPYLDEMRIRSYHETRNIPSLDATSHMSTHLRFGTVSVRELVKKAVGLNISWLNELIWREFFMQILWHYPAVVESSFKVQYDRIVWLNSEIDFTRWCSGKTGYPLVDAGMRELNATGYMHNRVRMITASFLVKHLLTDWRWGEAYFARKLMDFDLSANNGNWQWAAGCGCDAAPYFRIFNPVTQAEKFDPEKLYIRKWVPEYGTPDYPAPLVDHKLARERCLRAYNVVSRE